MPNKNDRFSDRIASDEGRGLMSVPTADGRLYHAHSSALVDVGAKVGRGTKVWAFVHILPGAVIGEDCNICDHAFIEDGVVVGDRVTVKCGISLWSGMTIQNDVFLGPNACFTNDKRPRSKKYPPSFPQTLLKEGCSMGANSTTLPGVTIGKWAMIGAGSVVTHDVPDYGLVLGNPARLVGWVCRCGIRLPLPVNQRMNCSCGLAYIQAGEHEVRSA